MYSVSLSIFSPCLFDSSTSYILKHISWQQTMEKIRKTEHFLFSNTITLFYTKFFIWYVKKMKELEILLKKHLIFNGLCYKTPQ